MGRRSFNKKNVGLRHMKMKKTTVSVGIPAFNEEANIAYLLRALLADSSKGVSLKEVIIVSDGSTDASVVRARSVNDRRIKIINRKQRLGIVATQNELLRHVQGDILVMLDADVIPVQSDFLDRITEPIRRNRNIGLVGAATIPLRPQTVFERVITNSHYMKQYIYKQINGGHNVYLCHGRARAFAKALYEKLHWVNNCPEDAYSYFACITRGFKFSYTIKAGVYFRSPQILEGHVKQSTRFVAGIKKIKKIFGIELAQKEYKIPRLLFMRSLIKYLWRNPFSTPAYLLLTLYIRLAYTNDRVYRSQFSVSQSSKRIVLFKGQKLSRI